MRYDPNDYKMLGDYKVEVQRLEDREDELIHENNCLRADLIELRNTRDELQKRIERDGEAFNQMRAERDEWKTRAMFECGRVGKAYKERNLLEAERDEAKSGLTEALTWLRSAQTERDEAERWEDRFGKMADACVKARKERDEAQKQCSRLNRELDDARNDLKDVQAKRLQVEADLFTVETTRNALRGELDRKTVECQELREENRKLQHQLEQWKLVSTEPYDEGFKAGVESVTFRRDLITREQLEAEVVKNLDRVERLYEANLRQHREEIDSLTFERDAWKERTKLARAERDRLGAVVSRVRVAMNPNLDDVR